MEVKSLFEQEVIELKIYIVQLEQLLKTKDLLIQKLTGHQIQVTSCQRDSFINEAESLFIQPTKYIHKWSETLKSSKIIIHNINNSSIVQCIGAKWESALFALSSMNISQSLITNSNVTLKVRFKNIESEDVAIGVCLRNKLEKMSFSIGDEMDNKGHGLFMMTCKGRIYSNSDTQVNCQKKGFKFSQRQILTIQIDKQKLKIKNDVGQSFTMRIQDEIDEGPLHFAVYFTGNRDCAEIIN